MAVPPEVVFLFLWIHNIRLFIGVGGTESND
jgi:hypothetical protein